MANRSGMGPGLAITIGLLSVTTVALFVTTVIFVAEARKQEGFVRDKQTALDVALGGAGEDANWQELRSAAGTTGVVPYLTQENDTLLTLIGMKPSRDDSESAKIRFEKEAEGQGNFLTLVETLQSQVISLNEKNAKAKRDRDDAVETSKATERRMQVLRDEAEETQQELTSQIDTLRAEVAVYRGDVSDTKQSIANTLAQREEQHATAVAELRGELRNARDKNAQLTEQVRRLSGETRNDRLTARDEASLVDATIININENQGEVFIDKGKASRVVLGMTFEVYSNGVSIRPNDEGEYPRGKATIEIIRIDAGNAVGRVLSSVRGQPILPGDRCVNAVWDPNKEYRFVVFGNFDANFDGFATPAERDQIQAIIAEWGGVIDDELTGRTDFVVLGERPILPPEPRPDDPFAVVDLYLQKRDIVDRYNELFETAGQRTIPVLNQNRLYTLTGLDNRPE